MVKKIFGMIALAAFMLTTAASAVEAYKQLDTIWVYEVGGSTAETPNCDELSPDVCAREYETFPDTNIPDMSKPTHNIVFGEKL